MSAEETQLQWLAKLTRLNPASGRGECRGKAPHKPLMLLALLGLAESGELPSRAFTRSPGLALRFRSYGSIVTDCWPTRLDLRMPFYHLSTQGFWQPLANEMHRAGSPESCAVCEMHPEFFALLTDATFRLKARMILVSRFFAPEERTALFETLGLQTGGRDEPTTARVLDEAEDARPHLFLDEVFDIFGQRNGHAADLQSYRPASICRLRGFIPQRDQEAERVGS